MCSLVRLAWILTIGSAVLSIATGAAAASAANPPALFDFGDTTQPLAQRDVSVVATQALALLNNPFVHARSEDLARRVETGAGSDPEKQVSLAWRLALGRLPSAGERVSALAHLRDVAAHPTPQPTPPPAVEPDALPSLRLWLRADQGVTTDAAGRVSSWRDQSGKGHDASQPAADARPELVADALAGRPALRFDGRARWLSVAGPVVTSPELTILAVATDRGSGSGVLAEVEWSRIVLNAQCPPKPVRPDRVPRVFDSPGQATPNAQK